MANSMVIVSVACDQSVKLYADWSILKLLIVAYCSVVGGAARQSVRHHIGLVQKKKWMFVLSVTVVVVCKCIQEQCLHNRTKPNIVTGVNRPAELGNVLHFALQSKIINVSYHEMLSLTSLCMNIGWFVYHV